MRFFISLLEQAMGALLTFAVNIWMARDGHPEAYGVYAFWLTIAWMAGTAQSTLVTSHLMSLPHVDLAQRRRPEQFFLTVQLIFIIGLTCLTEIFSQGMAFSGSIFTAEGAVLFVPGFLLFQYARALAFSRQRTVMAASITGCALLLCIVMIGFYHFSGRLPAANDGLLISGMAYGISALVFVIALMKKHCLPMRWRTMKPYLHYLHSSGWIFLGAASSELTNRLFSFATAWHYGASGLAVLSATQIALRPAWMISAAWTSIAQPRMAHMWAESRYRQFWKFLAVGTLIPVTGSLVWSALVFVNWDFLRRLLYHDNYANTAELILLWGGNVILGSILGGWNCALLATRRFRTLACTDILGAFVTCLAMVIVIRFLPYPFVITGTMMGQITQVIALGVVLYGMLRTTSRA